MPYTEERILNSNVAPPWLQVEESIETKALRQENEELRARLKHAEKLASAGTLLAGIAHELNNPLTVIQGLSRLIADEAAEGRRADPRVEKIASEAERSARIVRNLLQLCRPDGASAEELDLHGEIRQGVELAASGIPKAGIRVRLFLASDQPRMIGRRGALVQVLLNLVTNAAQAIQSVQPSGVIAVSCVTEGLRARVIVRDDGPGLSAAVIHRVFDPFFTTKATGNGIGLDLCRRTVEEMGGTLTAANAAGGGAVFTIELPLVEADVRAEKKAAGTRPKLPFRERRAPVPAKERRALVVDDEEQIMDLVEAVLHRRGFQTRRVSGAQEGADCADSAIGALQEEDFDLVISDYHMPGSGGRKLLEWLRTSGNPARTIVVSGDVLKPDTRAFVEGAGAAFLSKPFSLAELAGAVDRIMMTPSVRPC